MKKSCSPKHTAFSPAIWRDSPSQTLYPFTISDNKHTMHGKHGGHVPSTSDFLNAQRDKQTPGAAISTHADARLVHGVKGMRSTFDFLSLPSLFTLLFIN